MGRDIDKVKIGFKAKQLRLWLYKIKKKQIALKWNFET